MKHPLLIAALLVSGASAVGTGERPPALTGGPWLNTASAPSLASPSLTSLRGKVVLVNFWVYSCINCTESLPTLQGWYSKYHAQGLEILGVHTPEFESDKPESSVRAALKAEGVSWPVLQDNLHANWNRWANAYWPAFYLIDRAGVVRLIHAGEISSRFPQAIPEMDAEIRALLAQK